MTFSKQLRQLLRESGMTHAQCATYLNVSLRLLDYWLAGKKSPMNEIEREAYLRALRESTASLPVPPAG